MQATNMGKKRTAAQMTQPAVTEAPKKATPVVEKALKTSNGDIVKKRVTMRGSRSQVAAKSAGIAPETDESKQ